MYDDRGFGAYMYSTPCPCAYLYQLAAVAAASAEILSVPSRTGDVFSPFLSLLLSLSFAQGVSFLLNADNPRCAHVANMQEHHDFNVKQ